LDISTWIYNQIDYILIDRRWHSIVLDVQLFRTAECDTERSLVVAKVRDKLAGHKVRSHRFHLEKFNLKKLSKVEVIEQYHDEISDTFSALENLDTKVDINRAWETIRENMKLSAKESLGCYEL
jgi:hypothetical protein